MNLWWNSQWSSIQMPNHDNMSRKGSEIQFIHSTQLRAPGVASAEMQRLVHSHAARAAHAKVRRQSLIEYQAVKSSSGSEDERRPLSTAAAEKAMAAIPSPLGLLGSDRRDPFASFPRRLNPAEYYLLDYCKSASQNKPI